MVRSLAPAALLFLATIAAAQTAPPPSVRGAIDVIGLTPIDGSGIDVEKYPANVQLLRITGDSPGGTLVRRAVDMSAAETQGNEFQPDISFRGFSSSSLLGTPQGIAVFIDGVRFNEPFGDLVNWDLLHESSVASVQVIPGANAAFGLNALGGVIALRTRTGFSDPGQRARVSGGSFGSEQIDFSSGWNRAERAYFFSLSHESENGWRDFAPSRLDHAFASLERAGERSLSGARLTLADTMLTGNGAAPIALLDANRASVFTHPDRTRNRMFLLSLGHHAFRPRAVIEWNGYARRTSAKTLNGDESPYEPCAIDSELLCQSDEAELVLDREGRPFAITQAEPLDAALNRSASTQTSVGASGQFTREVSLLARTNRLTIGASADRGATRFAFDTEVASLTETRGAAGTARLAADSLVRLDATSTTISAFVADVVSVSPKLLLTAAARFNRTASDLRDRVGDALSGEHRFTSFNPSIGATYGTPRWTAFATISQSSRTPTPVELTCANPDDPCRLPNAFVSDPPLQQVIARGAEVGVRGRAGRTRWSLGLFTSANADDIIFVSSGPQRGSGYFTNVGRTNRRGLEVQLEGDSARLSWHASYAALHATFGEEFVVPSPRNPSAVDGEIHVDRGDRLPLLPRNMIKAGLNWRPADRITIAVEGRHASSAFFRGDEANLDAPLRPYTLLDAGIVAAVSQRLSFELSVRNATNAGYETFGTYGDASEVLDELYQDVRFVSPGAPRRILLSMSVRR